MRRVASVFPFLIVLLLGLLVAGPSPVTRAQDDATPAAEEDFELPEGVSFEALGYGTAQNLPSTGDILLFRIRLEPGASFPIEPDPAPGLAVVEEGTATFLVEAPITVLRAAGEGTPFPVQTEQVEAGTEVTLETGDSTVVPGDVAGEVRNDGDEEAVLLVALVTQVEDGGGATPEASPEGGAVPAE